MIKKTLFSTILALSVGAQAQITPTGFTWALLDCGQGLGNSYGCPPQASGNAILAFTDLINGPDTGLGDGSDDGAIVTVWGQNLGSTQGTSTIEYCDVDTDCWDIDTYSQVHYWKNADGTAPGGPANLYESHQMQEIAISIPSNAAPGLGTIKVTVNGDTSSIPFTVRPGNIYHVKSTGNDSTGDGSFDNPWLTVQGAQDNITADGSILYIHDVNSLSDHTGRGINWDVGNDGSATGTLAAQFGILAYPGFQPIARGRIGIHMYEGDAFVVSKMTVETGNCSSETATGQAENCDNSSGFTRGITTTNNGRTIANYVTDADGWCSDDSTGGGAIQGNSRYWDYIFNTKMLGNEIAYYACEGTTNQMHTTYFSIRSGSDNEQGPAAEVAWNYLHDNWAKNGIHFFDQSIDASGLCGKFTTPLNIHNNVITNQGGAGIGVNMGSNCSDNNIEINIYNNVLVDVGAATQWNGIDINTTGQSTSGGPLPAGISFGANSGTEKGITVYNNIIYNWDINDLSSIGRNAGALSFAGSGTTPANMDVDVHDNIFITDTNDVFHGWSNQGCQANEGCVSSGDNNVFFYTGGTASIPAWATNEITADPEVTVTGAQISIGATSSAIDGSTTALTRDIYGNIRATTHNIGAVE